MEGKNKKDQEEPCVPCSLIPGQDKVTYPCAPFQDYLTQDEEEALAMLRQLKEQASLVKERLRLLNKTIDFDLLEKDENELSPQQRSRQLAHAQLHMEWTECTKQLEELRTQWKEWDDKRTQANKVKMILLGHKA